jgi:hypothetical protein
MLGAVIMAVDCHQNYAVTITLVNEVQSVDFSPSAANAFFWVITQRVVVIPCRRFWTTYKLPLGKWLLHVA